MDLFQGFFGYGDMGSNLSQLGSLANTAVTGGSAWSNGVSQSNYYIFDSKQDILNAFGVNGGANINIGLTSFGLKAGFFNSIQMADQDLTIIVSAEQHQMLSGSNFQPLPNLNYYSNGLLGINKGITDKNKFIDQYGNSFISEMTVGGQFFGYFLLQTSKTGNKNQIVGQLNASFGTLLPLDINVGGNINKIINEKTCTVLSDCIMLGITGIAMPQPDQYIDAALQFPSYRLNAATVLEFSPSGYSLAGIS